MTEVLLRASVMADYEMENCVRIGGGGRGWGRLRASLKGLLHFLWSLSSKYMQTALISTSNTQVYQYGFLLRAQNFFLLRSLRRRALERLFCIILVIY